MAKSTNDFNKDQCWQVFGNNKCAVCDMYHADALHHILGRDGEFKNSIYNCAPVKNTTCHLEIHTKLFTPEARASLLTARKLFLEHVGYNPSSVDKNFIEKYKEWYTCN